MCYLFVSTGIHLTDSQQALHHIGKTMLEKNIVTDDYPAALLNREAMYPTGIALDQHGIAIPHCEAQYAKSPAIYLIRPDLPVSFRRADDEDNIAASLIIALIVTNPNEQIDLLRRLFAKLQISKTVEALLAEPPDKLGILFRDTVLDTSYHLETLSHSMI